MSPATIRRINNETQTIELKLIDIKVTLRHNIMKCQGCLTCLIACPKDAISRGPMGATARAKTEFRGVPPILIDPDKCSLCGVCDFICPFDAIYLLINDERQNQLVTEHALPTLHSEEKESKKLDFKPKRYFEGELYINPEKCVGGCSTCAIVCPMDAITIPKGKKGWEKVPKVIGETGQCKYCPKSYGCLLCGACVVACPAEGAIELHRTAVEFEGTFTTPFWPKIVKKLTTPLKSGISIKKQIALDDET
ncbi:MAG: 4Fe-4S dicluster domain-containing protein [Candidatus Helarchaeota archaeon]